MHEHITKKNGKIVKNCPKKVPNLSKIDPGGALEAILETRCFQDLIFDDFGSNLGPSWGPVRCHSVCVFLFSMFFEVAFRLPWPPFGLPKHLQNEIQKGAKTKT